MNPFKSNPFLKGNIVPLNLTQEEETNVRKSIRGICQEHDIELDANGECPICTVVEDAIREVRQENSGNNQSPARQRPSSIRDSRSTPQSSTDGTGIDSSGVPTERPRFRSFKDYKGE